MNAISALKVRERVSFLDRQILSFTHEVVTDTTASAHQHGHDFAPHPLDKLHRAGSWVLPATLSQLLPRLEGGLIQRHQPLIVRVSEFAAYRRRIELSSVFTRSLVRWAKAMFLRCFLGHVCMLRADGIRWLEPLADSDLCDKPILMWRWSDARRSSN